MITLTTEQAQQIEEALANTAEFSAAEQFAREQKAIATIRAARSQEQAEQEPMAIGAYEVVNERGNEWELVYPEAVHKYKIIPEHRITRTFYAAPVRTKDLTDDEILKVWNTTVAPLVHCLRAVIAADREKNRG